MSFEELLVKTQLVSREDIAGALEHALEDAEVLGKLLAWCGKLDEETASSAVKAFARVKAGGWSLDVAAKALKYWVQKNKLQPATFEDAMEELNWLGSRPGKAVTPQSTPAIASAAATPAAVTATASTTAAPTTNKPNGQFFGPDGQRVDGAKAVWNSTGGAQTVSAGGAQTVSTTAAPAVPDGPARAAAATAFRLPAMPAKDVLMMSGSDARAKADDVLTKDEAQNPEGAIAVLAHMAEQYFDKGEFAKAQEMYEQIVRIRKTTVGDGDPNLVQDLANVARVMCVQRRFLEAEKVLEEMIRNLEQGDPDKEDLAAALGTLAQVYFYQEKLAACEPVLIRSMKLKQEALGPDHVELVAIYQTLARLLEKTNRTKEAEAYNNYAKMIMVRKGMTA